MRISANRINLLNAVKTALRALGHMKDLPELSSLLFEADANTGIITITGTDTHTQIQCRLRNEHVLEGGSMLIKPIVGEMLKLLPGEKKKIRFVFTWYFPNHITKDGKTVLIPAIRQVVIETNVEEGVMRIRPMKGLFDDED